MVSRMGEIRIKIRIKIKRGTQKYETHPLLEGPRLEGARLEGARLDGHGGAAAPGAARPAVAGLARGFIYCL